jgi:hypothetical protein
MGDGVKTKVPYNPVYARGLFANKQYGGQGQVIRVSGFFINKIMQVTMVQKIY